jgi:hypothetical protein
MSDELHIGSELRKIRHVREHLKKIAKSTTIQDVRGWALYELSVLSAGDISKFKKAALTSIVAAPGSVSSR